MRIYVDRQTHMPFYLPIQCPVGFCEPGVSAGPDCCGCYLPPPPPCGRCSDETDIEYEDNFDNLDPFWEPDITCEPTWTPSPWCRWFADGQLACDSYYYDGTIPDGVHRIFGDFSEAMQYWRLDIDFASCKYSTDTLYTAMMNVGMANLSVEYRGVGQGFGTVQHTTTVFVPGTSYPLADLYPPYHLSMSLTDNGANGHLCVAFDDELYLDIDLIQKPPINASVQLVAGGDHGRFPSTYNTVERIAAFDNFCIASLDVAPAASSRLRQWLASVNK